MKNSSFLRAAIAAAALAALPAAAQDVVKIGQIEAQTGPLATYGWMGSQGAKLAIEPPFRKPCAASCGGIRARMPSRTRRCTRRNASRGASTSRWPPLGLRSHVLR